MAFLDNTEDTSKKFLDSTIDSNNNYLGAPIYDNLKFPKGKYNNIKGGVTKYDELAVNTVTLLIKQSKSIVRTPVNGRDGTIKEYVNTGDYIIEVNGKLSVSKGFPDEQLKAFAGLQDVPKEIPVVCKILNDFVGVRDVVVDNFEFQSPLGSLNSINFRMTLISDMSDDLKQFELGNI